VPKGHHRNEHCHAEGNGERIAHKHGPEVEPRLRLKALPTIGARHRHGGKGSIVVRIGIGEKIALVALGAFHAQYAVEFLAFSHDGTKERNAISPIGDRGYKWPLELRISRHGIIESGFGAIQRGIPV